MFAEKNTCIVKLTLFLILKVRFYKQYILTNDINANKKKLRNFEKFAEEIAVKKVDIEKLNRNAQNLVEVISQFDGSIIEKVFFIF